MSKKNSKKRISKSNKSFKKKKSDNKEKFGVFPIYRTKHAERHPHVVVLQGKDENISVGLTTKNASGDLIPVKYSNGKKAFMKRSASRKKKSLYERKQENYFLDKESEKIAYQKAIYKMLKDIDKKK